MSGFQFLIQPDFKFESSREYECLDFRFESSLEYECLDFRFESSLEYECLDFRFESSREYECLDFRFESSWQYKCLSPVSFLFRQIEISLRRADLSSRVVLPILLCLSVIVKPR